MNPNVQNIIGCAYVHGETSGAHVYMHHPYGRETVVESLENMMSRILTEDSPGQVSFQFDPHDIMDWNTGKEDPEEAIALVEESILKTVNVHQQQLPLRIDPSQGTIRQAVAYVASKDDLRKYEIGSTISNADTFWNDTRQMAEALVSRVLGCESFVFDDEDLLCEGSYHALKMALKMALPDHCVGFKTESWQ